MAGSVGAVVVIGATGILRPAAQTLLERGASVVAIARDASALAALARASAEVTLRAVDARDAVALARSLDGLGLRGAIAYDPALSADSWTVLARLVDGPVVRVLTSSAADPSRPSRLPPPYPFTHLVLGWTDDGRWHSPSQVSAAAIEAFAEAGMVARRAGWTPASNGAVLGRIRPWSQRPD